VHNLNEELKKYAHAPKFVLEASNTKYTRVGHTHWMNFRWDIGAVKQPAKARMTLYFYKSRNPVNFILKKENRNAKGVGSDRR